MTQAERIEAIRLIQEDPDNKTEEVRMINYKGVNTAYPVYEIPLDYLVYNVVNGRIRSRTRSYEERFEPLNPENEDHINIIEQYLFDSAKGRNEKTLESIETIGQQESGIITQDGVVIDGNRRSLLLRMINRKNKTDVKFKAVILEDSLQGNEEEIIKLETSYQMGVDSKVDYNPIEKYIRCKELNAYYDISTIGQIMAEEDKQINEWLEILNLMESYLAYIGTPFVYTRLDKKEGHFVDLVKYLRQYNRGNHQNVDWNYNSDDVNKLRDVYFDYIRLGVPVQKARVIARPNMSNSFFCHESIWKDFIEERDSTLNGINEISLETLKANNDTDSVEDLILQIEINWKEQVSNELDDILSFYSGLLEDILADFAPLRLLKRAKSALSRIDIVRLNNNRDEEINALISDIEAIINNLK